MTKSEYENADMCISHQNSLWLLFRVLSEEMEVPESVGEHVRRNIGVIRDEP